MATQSSKKDNINNNYNGTSRDSNAGIINTESKANVTTALNYSASPASNTSNTNGAAVTTATTATAATKPKGVVKQVKISNGADFINTSNTNMQVNVSQAVSGSTDEQDIFKVRIEENRQVCADR